MLKPNIKEADGLGNRDTTMSRLAQNILGPVEGQDITLAI